MSIPAVLVELAKTGVVKLTEETVKTFVDTKIKPIFINWGKDESRSIELEECLSEYLMRCYAKNNIMTTIVFGRLRKTLEDLYIPLTLEEYRNEDIKWVIDENCYNILDNYSRILIVDMAGMGKSTIVKYFACQGINLNKCIPIVIELRRLEKKQSIPEYIQTQINSLDKNLRIEEIVDILKKGDFVIFFDGYDEIANESKSDVLDAIQEFTGKASNTKIVITSREEDDLNSLGEYKCVNIKPLTEEEAYKLIKKYDNDGKISEKLNKRLKEDSSMKVLNEFLVNPLLVSLLYKTFEYKEEIPYKKIDFYEQVYEAVFNDHDKTKGSAYTHEKKTKLSKHQFEQILRTFGFLCLKIGKVEYGSQLIHDLLEQSVGSFVCLKIIADDFLYDITHAVPFLQRDGNEYRWVHKSFMEYFASCFISVEGKEFEEKYYHKMTKFDIYPYYNVLDFCAEINPISFRKFVVLPYIKHFVNEYVNYFENEYFADFDEEAIKMAKQLLILEKEVCIINDIKFKRIHEMKPYDNSKEAVFERNKIFEEVYQKYNLSDNLIVANYNNRDERYIIRYGEKLDFFMYDLILRHIPEIFENVIFEDIPLISEENMKIDFNDNIDNPISYDKEEFRMITKRIFLLLFQPNNSFIEYKVLDYNKCIKAIREIESIDINKSGDIFDW